MGVTPVPVLGVRGISVSAVGTTGTFPQAESKKHTMSKAEKAGYTFMFFLWIWQGFHDQLGLAMRQAEQCRAL
jgi:hypothetical protein